MAGTGATIAAVVGAAALAALAIMVALLAIRCSDKIAQAADAALVRERRETFELDVLARLAQALGYYSAGFRERRTEPAEAAAARGGRRR